MSCAIISGMPAKTAAERQRERRARLRNNADQSELEAYKKKERKRKRASMKPDELDRIRRGGGVKLLLENGD
jgi:hypothetical protein